LEADFEKEIEVKVKELKEEVFKLKATNNSL
jgi:hypothetical protein